MNLRNVGQSGLRVSAVGLGCNNFGLRIDLEASRKVVHKALDSGVTLFDTADSYGHVGGSETILGQTLEARRKDIVLATKFGRQLDEAGILKGASRKYVMSAVESSLRRLRTDWIDLYQLHVPDPLTPIEETLRALEDLVREGKVRYIGCSKLPAWRVVEAQWTARRLRSTPFISCQYEYSLLAREIEEDAVPALAAYGLGLLPFFPLASGLLTGKYRRAEPPPEGTRFRHLPHLSERYWTESNWQVVERLAEFCARKGRTLLEVAFAWLLAKPPVASVIAGATRPEQVEQNVAAAECVLTSDETAELDRLTAPAATRFSGANQ
jgi:aryl-alcohol dehydrogenase-like predicted oxidoreductase